MLQLTICMTTTKTPPNRRLTKRLRTLLGQTRGHAAPARSAPRDFPDKTVPKLCEKQARLGRHTKGVGPRVCSKSPLARLLYWQALAGSHRGMLCCGGGGSPHDGLICWELRTAVSHTVTRRRARWRAERTAAGFRSPAKSLTNGPLRGKNKNKKQKQTRTYSLDSAFSPPFFSLSAPSNSGIHAWL